MWFALAVGASVLWGLTYALDEKIYEHISVATSLAIGCLASLIIVSIFAWSTGALKNDLKAITSSRSLLGLIALGTLTFVLAELLIGFSIQAKSATLAGLIEISYPIFIALFSYILFKEKTLNIPTLIGGVLIFSGVFVVYYFNK